MSKTKTAAKPSTKPATKAAKRNAEHQAAAPLAPVSASVLDAEKHLKGLSPAAFAKAAGEYGYHGFSQSNTAELRTIARCRAEEIEDVEATVATHAPVDFAAMKAEQAAIDADAADDKFLAVANQLNEDASLERATPHDPIVTAKTDGERETDGSELASETPGLSTDEDVAADSTEPKGPTIRERLRAVIAETLADLNSGRYTSEMQADAVTAAITARFGFMVRKPREPKTTERANALKLPEVGTTVTIRRKAAFHKITIVDVSGRRMVEYNGQTFDSLKAAATALCGYPPSIGGWQFFFGRLDMDEVNRKYAPVQGPGL